MVVRQCVNVKMEIVMNDLTKEELKKIYNNGKNLTPGKPIYIDFHADW